MVDLGKLAKKAKDLADKHGDKISSAVDKTTDLVDRKTGGKHADKLQKLDGLARKLDKTAPGHSTAPEPPAPVVPAAEPSTAEAVGDEPPAPPTPG
jgi:hypothetical protein